MDFMASIILKLVGASEGGGVGDALAPEASDDGGALPEGIPAPELPFGGGIIAPGGN